MQKSRHPKTGQEETKTRIPVWLYPSTLEAMDAAMAQDNCKSRSVYLEKAALFYAGFLSGEAACDFLPPALVAALRGTVRDSDNRVARLLFKLTVEISEADLHQLRARCVREIKQTNGSISLKDAVNYQKGL